MINVSIDKGKYVHLIKDDDYNLDLVVLGGIIKTYHTDLGGRINITETANGYDIEVINPKWWTKILTEILKWSKLKFFVNYQKFRKAFE